MKKYTFFWNPTKPYSNWYPCEFNYKNKHFYNSEQAYMWEKALKFNDYETADQILEYGSDPRTAKKLGKSVKDFSDKIWDQYKFDIMYDINMEKYKQNPDLKKTISENSNFAEASPYDLVWGVGFREDDPLILDSKNWKGENLLGKVLDKVKNNLK